ncbi:Uma2 family endonuclease [Streptomyces phaeochromogenes]|jgi:Uma2 family endonuclease|uniref:Uma2 family endonuclease n=1 Tax=Streptomyces phaeochromogenes TaxID=1923 RepID=UPI00278D1495|nr:Uma2 family endonuclease [Streptomyces phaeochromogenes]MDQ0950116.1 Uma2 family endonuclease [Streptomyces phaeochromogenes]
MSAAPVEQPHGDRSLIAEANRIMDRLPGRRVEIIGGQILVTPSPDVAHSRALKKAARPFEAAGLDEDETEIHQAIGVWLPDGPEDYAIPDLCIVEADIDEHLVENNSYDPVVFRLVLEVTSSNWQADLRTKVTAYAQAKIPVYVIVDRKHQRLHVLTDPTSDKYTTHRIHAPGELVTLPDSIGAKVTLDVAEILKAGQTKRD